MLRRWLVRQVHKSISPCHLQQRFCATNVSKSRIVSHEFEYPVFEEHIVPNELRDKFKKLRTMLCRKNPELYTYLIQMAVQMCYQDPQLLRNAYYQSYRPHWKATADQIEAGHNKWVDKVDEVLLQNFPHMNSTDNALARPKYDAFTLTSAFSEILTEGEDLEYVEEIANDVEHEFLEVTVPQQNRQQLCQLLQHHVTLRKQQMDTDMALIPHTELLDMLMERPGEFYTKCLDMFRWDQRRTLQVLQRAFLLGGKEDVKFLKFFADLLLRKGYFHRACELMETIISVEPHSIDWILKLGRVYQFGKRQSAKAVQFYKQSLTLVPDPHIYCKVGEIVAKQGNKMEAATFFQKAREIAPADGQVMTGYALFLEHYHNMTFDELLPVFENAVQLEPEHAAAEAARYIATEVEPPVVFEVVTELAEGTSDPFLVLQLCARYYAGYDELREHAEMIYEHLFQHSYPYWHTSKEEYLEVLALYHCFEEAYSLRPNVATKVYQQHKAAFTDDDIDKLTGIIKKYVKQGRKLFEEYKPKKLV